MTNVFQMDFSDKEYVRSTLIFMFTFFLMYALTYRQLRRRININPEYECRLLTFAHGLFASVCGLHYIVFPAIGLNKVESIPYQLILTNSMGYFTFDLLWCFIHNDTGLVKFHHIVTCSGLVYYSFKLKQQYFIVYSLGLTEFTNPFLQLRWYLKYHGMRDTILFKIIETMFIVLFFSIRIFVLSYYTYLAWTDKTLDFSGDDLFFITLGMIVGYSLSYQMLSYILHQFKKTKSELIQKEE